MTDALAPSLLGPLGGAAAPATTGTAGGGGDFGAAIAGAVDNLQALQATSDALAVRAVTGDLDDVHDYTIASAQSSMAFELTAAIRNKAVDAFTEIMRMQA
ncbi:flagellar hook-basal body protein FliE [Cellulomonas bogoriensis 69B4 = DSM 16987]|uniref:Flagellar hook-basal body complex protein FliE n=1 Tax=Cellulomonas bogoriensis 69B4 = DSM 16987 TaxID=1386082 RepID=A0A0A0BQK9_9CELL|nr:flagellar hook-basal body protein FliE [Cellulomonas bogoriensis 69B4 = DSM 16987]